MSSFEENPEIRHPRILRLPEVMRRTGDCRSTIYRLDKKGILRRAKQLDGCHTAGWLEDSVDAYIESRRPDAVNLPEGVEAGQTRASKVPASIRPGVGSVRASAGMCPNRIAKPDKDSGDLHATTMKIQGNRVYLHGPTGKLFMEIGSARGFPTGIGIVGTDHEMDATEVSGAVSGQAKRKRGAVNESDPSAPPLGLP